MGTIFRRRNDKGLDQDGGDGSGRSVDTVWEIFKVDSIAFSHRVGYGEFRGQFTLDPQFCALNNFVNVTSVIEIVTGEDE